MKKKTIALITVPLLLIFIGVTGKNYADNVLNWGGEDNIALINSNLDKLNNSLSNKEQ